MKQVSSHKTPKVRKKSDNVKVIEQFVNLNFGLDKYFWGRESKFAKKLIEKYKLDFILSMPLPNGFRIQSLVWFFTTPGQHYLSEQLVEYSKRNTNLSHVRQEISLSETKIGEDIEVVSKPKTLKDFLKYGKTTDNQNS
jgi:hypothetical protein